MQDTKSFSLVPTNLTEAKELANLISKSDLVPKDYQDKPGNVLVAIQMGQELGLQPMQALQGIAVINGKPAVYGDAMLALVRGNALCESLSETISGEGEQAVATCTIKRKGEKVDIVRRFSVADAKKAGLWGKTGPWTNYPQRMLQMRARAWACRDAFPDVLKGISVAEEIQDVREIGDADVVERGNIQPPKAVTIPPLGAPISDDDVLRPVIESRYEPQEEVILVNGMPVPEKDGTTKLPAAVPEGDPIVKGAIKIVQMQLDKAKLTGVDLEANFGVNQVANLKQSQVNAVMDWARGKLAHV